ncbi:MAG: hypothetical protein ACK4NA_10670 [Alphaproteobacteria bacterium]
MMFGLGLRAGRDFDQMRIIREIIAGNVNDRSRSSLSRPRPEFDRAEIAKGEILDDFYAFALLPVEIGVRDNEIIQRFRRRVRDFHIGLR